MAHKAPSDLTSYHNFPATLCLLLIASRTSGAIPPSRLCPDCSQGQGMDSAGRLAAPPHQDSMAGSHRPAAATPRSQAAHPPGTVHPSLCSAGAAAGSPQCRSLSRGSSWTTVTTVGTCREKHICPVRELARTAYRTGECEQA